MKYVLVTGGHGFIGRYVVEQLLEREYRVHVLDRKSPPEGDQAITVFGDIKDATLVNEAIAHVDGVIHLAGVLGTQETIANPLPAAETNILGGLNVLQACSQYDVPLVNIAVGNYWMNNTYSITKNTIERFVDMYVRFRGARMTVVRALNAFGPRQVAAAPYGPSRVRKIMPSFICRALSGEDIEVYGDGTQVMDMVYVADAARVLVEALEWTDKNGAFRGDPLEAGTGRDTTVNDIAEAVIAEVERQTGKRVGLVHLPMRPGEDERSVVLGKPDALRDIGIDPASFLGLEQGVAKAVAYFAEYIAQR